MAVFVVDKPLGPTSHDVVARARRALGTRRVGHAGTLDPLATGVLVVLSEGATKLSPYLTASDKGYLAWVALGVGSATLDAEGPISERVDPSGIVEDDVRGALQPFLALQTQLPPRHSAVQVEGVRAYAAARRGDEVALAPRPVGYRDVTLLDFAPDAALLPDRFAPDGAVWRPDGRGRPFDRPAPLAPAPTALLHLTVAAGTYVRAFARDLGAALGVPAHLAGLVRTRAGAARLEDAMAPDALAGAAGVDPVPLLPYPTVRVGDAEAAAVVDGRTIRAAWTGRAAIVGPDGRLLAIADAEGPEARVRYARVWRTPP